MRINTLHSIGDFVSIDGDKSIRGLIESINIKGCFGETLVTYEVVWFNCGSQQSAWISEWRLDPWEG